MIKIILLIIFIAVIGIIATKIGKYFLTIIFIMLSFFIAKNFARVIRTLSHNKPETYLKKNETKKKKMSKNELEIFMIECNAQLEHEDEMKQYESD